MAPSVLAPKLRRARVVATPQIKSVDAVRAMSDDELREAIAARRSMTTVEQAAAQVERRRDSARRAAERLRDL